MILASTINLYAGGPGSGCRGDNCGRKTFYHGTTEDKLPSIMNEGLRGRRVYVAKTYNTASNYARSLGWRNGKNPVVLELRLPASEQEKLKVDTGAAQDNNDASFHKGNIKPEFIYKVHK